MPDYLQRLVTMVPPPKEPYEAGDAEGFARVESDLGLKLPGDYKNFIHTYGTGQWQEFWYVLNPFSANEYGNLVTQSQNRRPTKWSALDAERTIRDGQGHRYPHPIYPEPGGILPWAITD